MQGTAVLISDQGLSGQSIAAIDVQNVRRALAGDHVDSQKLATSLANINARLACLRGKSGLTATVAMLSEHVKQLPNA